MTESNFMQPWLDLQKKMLDSWQVDLGVGSQNDEKKENNIFAQSIKPVHDALDKWVNFANNVYAKNVNQFDNPQYQEIIEKITSTANFNQNLNGFWEDLQACITGKESDPFRFYTRWNENYTKLISNQFGLFLPEQVKEFLGKGMNIYSLSTNTTNDFFKPWLDKAQNMHNLLLKSITGDQSAYIEFIKLWQDNFSSSFGKILNIPQFSMNREQMQKQMSGISSLITFINTLNEYVATLLKTSQDTFEKIVKDYQAMVIDGSNPKTYKEFYEYWWKQNEAAYLQLFGTSEFAKLIAQLLEAGANFKKKYDDLLEKQLEFLPYPTKTDMDSVYKTLDTLKREVRALKKELAALKEETGNNSSALKED